MGEGSVACAMGLTTGLGILITQRYFSEEVLHQLLVFRPADFFTCASTFINNNVILPAME